MVLVIAVIQVHFVSITGADYPGQQFVAPILKGLTCGFWIEFLIITVTLRSS